MIDFKILSAREEDKLSLEDKKKYYENLREYVLNRKLTNTTRGAYTIAPKLKGVTNKLASALTRKVFTKNAIHICDGQEFIPDSPCIFAYTHQGILDNFIWIPYIKQHALLLHGAEVNKLLWNAQLNTGLIGVKKEDKENNHNAKLDMIYALLKGKSITYFPEGTWCMSPNKLHLPLSYGFLDTARKANVPVVPGVFEFTYDTTSEKEKIIKTHVRYGKPIYITLEDDILEKLEEYKESISTMRYELLEEKGLYDRNTITNSDYINYLKGCYKNLKLGKLDTDKERRNIFGANSDFYLFHHINDIPYDKDGNLLETEESIKLKKLLIEHGIIDAKED